MGVVGLLWAARGRPFFGPVFRFFPVPFWCYFLPMLGSTGGLLPAASPLYGFLSRYLLPLCLALLLVNVPLRALFQVGWPAAGAMAFGVAGIVGGALISFTLFHSDLPPESWKAVGALAGSWVGGSANMLAVKEALSAPESVFAPVVIVDTFFAYGWMALLIFLAGFQRRFDAWTGARFEGPPPQTAQTRPARFERPLLGAVSLALTAFSLFLGDRLPALGDVFSRATWTVLLVTTFSLAFSAGWSALSLKASPFVETLGTFFLYVLLTSMGAKARLGAIVEAPLFLLLGLVWMLIHGAVLLLGGRILRAPLFLLATASQACVGGPVSAPLVAAVYRPELPAVGLLLAIAGNVSGTYVGLAVARLCRWIAS